MFECFSEIFFLLIFIIRRFLFELEDVLDFLVCQSLIFWIVFLILSILENVYFDFKSIDSEILNIKNLYIGLVLLVFGGGGICL